MQAESNKQTDNFVHRFRRFCREQYFSFSLFLPWLIFSLMIIPQHSVSQNKTMDAPAVELLKKHVREAAQNARTLSCDFTQEKEMSLIAEKITSRGKFYLKKEKLLRWEYLQPFTYLIIFRDDKIFIKDENKVTSFNIQSNKLFLEINRIILGSIQGTLLSDDQNFKATFSESKTGWIVKLKTQSVKLKETLTDITIYFNRDDFSVSRVEMNEPGGDCTRLTFTARKTNQPIPDEAFLVN